MRSVKYKNPGIYGRIKHIFLNKAFIVLMLYVFMIIYGFSSDLSVPNITPNDIDGGPAASNPLDKIDPSLVEKMSDPYTSSETSFRVIVMLNDGYSGIDIPKGAAVLKNYTIINGLLMDANSFAIYTMAYDPAVKSIWEDHREQSDPSALNGMLPEISAASSNIISGYVNVTDEISARDLWDMGYNGSGIVIAVLDTGVDITGSAGGDLDDFDENTSTPDVKYLAGVSMVPDEPFYYSDLNGRGTFHAGIACGTGNLNKSYVGVAPGAYYLNVKIYDSIGITYWSFIISGIEWAVEHSADIMLFAATIPGLYMDPVCEAVNNAVDRGVIVVAPAGDDGPGYMSINTPGAAFKALVVGAYDSFTGDVADFSSRGPSFDFSVRPHVIAPGVGLVGPRSRIFSEQAFDMLENVGSLSDELSQYGFNFDYSLDIDSSMFSATMVPETQYGEEVPGAPNYTRASGTGAAAAVVSGAAALLLSAFPLATPALIQQALMETAVPVRNIKDENAQGAGLINVSAAFDYLSGIFNADHYTVIPTGSPLLYPGAITSMDYANVSQYAEFSNNDILQYDITGLFSTQAMLTTIVVSNSTEPDYMNMSSIHMPLSQFGIQYRLSGDSSKKVFHWFSEMDVAMEMHQMMNNLYYQEGYKRYAGILTVDGLYIVIIAETWSYAGVYTNQTYQLNVTNPYYNFTLPTEYNMLNITDRVEAFKFTFEFINNRKDGRSFTDLSLLSYFKADLYLNETGLVSQKGLDKNLAHALDYSLDDNLTFIPDTQILYVVDKDNGTFSVIDDKYTAMGFTSFSHNITRYAMGDGIDLLMNITFEGTDSPYWNTTTDQYLEMEGNGTADPAFAVLYDLGTVAPEQKVEFQAGLGLGQKDSAVNATNVMKRQLYLIENNVTKYNISDLAIISANFSRMAPIGESYNSRVMIINLGNIPFTKSQVAFAINKSNQVDVWNIYSTIYIIHDFEPFEILEYSASWMPLEEGVYSVGWIVGDLSDITTMQNEANLLSNSLSRIVYIYNGTYYESISEKYFSVFPNHLDQNPMRLYAPMDFGIYNLSVYSIAEIPDVIIKAEGIGRNTLIFMESLANMSGNRSLSQMTAISDGSIGISPSDHYTPGVVDSDGTFIIDDAQSPSASGEGPLCAQLDDSMGMSNDNMSSFNSMGSLASVNIPHSINKTIKPYTPLSFILIANPFMPPGKIEFNITFTRSGEDDPFYVVPVELTIYPNRGRIWFDATHLNLFVSQNFVGTDALSNIGVDSLDSLNLSTDISESFGSFGDLSDLSFDSADSFDLTRFIDLNERLDTTWGNYFKLRQIWADPASNHGKGASMYTMIPFLSINLTELTGMENITSFRTEDIVPPDSFLGNSIGDYYFENEIFTTNTINHDNLQFFDVFILNDPEQALLSSEIDALEDWVEKGGTLFVWVEDKWHTNLESVNQLLERFDLRVMNETFFPFDDYGYYNVSLTAEDKVNDLFRGDDNVSVITFKDPLEIKTLDSSNQNIRLLGASPTGKPVMAVERFGKGRVMVVGDHDAFQEKLLKLNDNLEFSKCVLRWGLSDYYASNISITPSVVPLYEAGFIDFNITNYDFVKEKGLLDKGFLFISAFFYENGTPINATLYNIKTPIMPMFKANESHYSQYLDTRWYLVPGDYYVMMMIDHPAAASEIFYVRFTVIDAPEPEPLKEWEREPPAYPQYIDIIGIIGIVHIFLLIWYYNFKKYETRLEIIPLKGEFLNEAKTKLSEARALIKLAWAGVHKEELEDIDRIRFLLSYRKRFRKFFDDLRDFGESIGEHF